MKITYMTVPYPKHATAPAAVSRGHGAKAVTAEAALPAPAPAVSANEAAVPAQVIGRGEPKAVPPGLERVLARLQESAAPARNAGQANALEVISRNIARYVETQAMTDAPAPVVPPAGDPSGATSGTQAPGEPAAASVVASA